MQIEKHIYYSSINKQITMYVFYTRAKNEFAEFNEFRHRS